MSDDTNDLVTIRLTAENSTFGYKGTLFKKFDDQSLPANYDVDADTAAELCDGPDARFRRVDSNGDVIPSDHDVRAERAEHAEQSSRTFVVPPKGEATKPAEKTEPKKVKIVAKKVETKNDSPDDADAVEV